MPQASFLLIPLAMILIAALITVFILAFQRKKPTHNVFLGWFLALFPLSALITLINLASQLTTQHRFTWQYDWLPSLGISLSLSYDSLSALFSIIVIGIGTLVTIYTGYYFKGKAVIVRFYLYLFLFMFSMLGLVMAGDLITLFLFWEGTSITSFLLIGFQSDQIKARQGAFISLLLTAGGGVALLLGSLLIQYVSGSFEFTAIQQKRELLLSSNLYPFILILVALGAFTKSAQAPFHFWLPNAMSAPTPASAYLHSATMVKAGIYLMARLNPSLGFSELWFWLLSLTGFVTLLLGAYLGLKQNDLKGLLAYSTVSQLGALMALIAQDTSIAFKALVIGVVAHALYKSALFLLVGIIDHETGTRDLRTLGGLRKIMPGLYFFTVIASLSMAGLPPLFGFLAKETLLATTTHPSVPACMDIIFPIITVLAGALMMAQAGMLVWDTFNGEASRAVLQAHRPAFLWVAMPAIPALISLALGILPEPKWLAQFLAQAAQNAYSSPVKVSLALWTGISVPLMLSGVVILSGSTIFLMRRPIRQFQNSILTAASMQNLYQKLLDWLDILAGWATRLQSGRLRSYLVIMFITVGILLAIFGNLPFHSLWEKSEAFDISLRFSTDLIRLYVLLITLGAALASVILRRDLFAVLALGVSGFATAIWFLLEPAPDVALVQVVVDILAVVTLVLALVRLPRVQRLQIPGLDVRIKRFGFWRDLSVSLVAGAVVTLATFEALSTRPRESLVSPYYQTNAKALTGASDIVSGILVDFRAFDTLIEVTVFAMAGLAVYSLLRCALTLNKKTSTGTSNPQSLQQFPFRHDPLLRALGAIVLPLALMLAATQIMFGHNQPGDGFTAGVITSLAIALNYILFGYQNTRLRLSWINPRLLIVSGLLILLFIASISLLYGGSFFANLDISQFVQFPMPKGFKLSTSFLFEVAIFILVLGSMSFIIDSLGHPGEQDERAELIYNQSEIEAE